MMKRLLLVAFILCSSIMVAQTTITGTVNDATYGGPLPGANIKVLRKAVGTSTDFDGKFTLQVTDKPPFTIEISLLGYGKKSVEITESFVLISSSFTILKGTLTSLAWLSVLVYSIKWVILKINEKNNKQTLTTSKLD